MPVVFEWEIDLSTLIGRKIVVETVEGIKRIGALRKATFGDPIEIVDRKVAVPVAIQFDDEADLITFARIRSIRLHHERG